jgi:hypothetical protein
MKFTFFFIAMLLIVNCSQDLVSPTLNEADSTLLEIAKSPSSEAVFATMSIQMEAQGGFDKVMELLNQLVHDSKEQLHSMTKVWRGVNTRCHVSKMKLTGRQEFFETYLHQAERNVRRATERLSECRHQLTSFNGSVQTYSTLLKSEVARHHVVASALKARAAHANAGLKSLESARNAVGDWTPKARALVQTHLMDVSASYLQVQDYELPSVTEFLERTTDAKVRTRLMQWMGKVRSQLQVAANSFQHSMEKLNKVGTALEESLSTMVVSLKSGLTQLNKCLTYTQHMIEAGKTTTALFANLAKQNTGLMAANAKYCAAESVSYNSNRVQAVAAVKLFREIRAYFGQHYTKMNSYIMTKYNKN